MVAVKVSQVTGLDGSIVKMMAVGKTHTLVLLNDGSLWGAGSNLYGQLGTGTPGIRPLPSKIPLNDSVFTSDEPTDVATSSSDSQYQMVVTRMSGVGLW